jgi:N-acetylmuramoyl-L-alanine amidase
VNYSLMLLALCVWREARGEVADAKLGVAWSIMNRAKNPGWWGSTLAEVVLKPYQYSSFNHNDPNATKWPPERDNSWLASCDAAQNAFSAAQADLTGGATHYFDKSLDANPPAWAAEMKHTCDIGNLHFYTRA